MIAGVCLVVITLIIPWGVFTRYVLNSASSWPEPMAMLLMIWFSFMSAVVCYREHLHIGVAVIPMMLQGSARVALGWLIEACMMATNLFMLLVGHQARADHLVPVDRGFPLVFGRRVLSAGPDRRRDHGALRHRAAVDLEICSPSPTPTQPQQISTE